MIEPRPQTVDEQQQARITRDVVGEAGGIERAAAIIGKRKSQVGRYQSPHEPDSITFRDMERLEAVTHGKGDHPAFARYLANRAGYVLTKLPDAPPNPRSLMQFIGQMTKEMGDISQHILEDLEDDKIDDPKGAIEECMDLARVNAALIQALEILAEG